MMHTVLSYTERENDCCTTDEASIRSLQQRLTRNGKEGLFGAC